MKKLKRLGRRMFALILATVLCLGGAPELTVQAAQSVKIPITTGNYTGAKGTTFAPTTFPRDLTFCYY
nr:hypothetical protein [uncultured Acetatifactor sp.]